MTEDDAVAADLTYRPPTAVFENAVPDPIRIESYQTVLNRSDLNSILQIK